MHAHIANTLFLSLSCSAAAAQPRIFFRFPSLKKQFKPSKLLLYLFTSLHPFRTSLACSGLSAGFCWPLRMASERVPVSSIRSAQVALGARARLIQSQTGWARTTIESEAAAIGKFTLSRCTTAPLSPEREREKRGKRNGLCWSTHTATHRLENFRTLSLSQSELKIKPPAWSIEKMDW